MNLTLAANLISEGMIVADHAKEPMMIRVRYILAPLPDAKMYEAPALIAATKKVLALNPRLLSHFVVKASGITLTQSEVDLDAMAAAIWQEQNSDLQTFERMSVGYDSAPLFRLRLTREDGLMLAAHHALFDGRSGMQLLAVLLSALIASETLSMKPPMSEERKLPFFTRIILRVALVRESLQQKWTKLFHPPVLLGPKDRFFGESHAFVSKTTDDGDMKARLERIRLAVPEVTLNNCLITALHLAIDEDLQRQRARGEIYGGDDRIAVMVPVDLRKGRPWAEVLANLSASVSVSSYSEDRKDPLLLLAKVKARMIKVRELQLALASVRSLYGLRLIGFYRMCRRILLTHALPRRAVKHDKNFWRWVDTALLSNVGEPQFPESISPYIVRIIGFAPAIPPMGLTICFGSGSRSTINFHSSNATLSEEKNRWLMERMLHWVETLARLASPAEQETQKVAA